MKWCQHWGEIVGTSSKEWSIHCCIAGHEGTYLDHLIPLKVTSKFCVKEVGGEAPEWRCGLCDIPQAPSHAPAWLRVALHPAVLCGAVWLAVAVWTEGADRGIFHWLCHRWCSEYHNMPFLRVVSSHSLQAYMHESKSGTLLRTLYSKIYY